MGNELPYMPTFIGDFMTAVAIWPPERVGAYWLALMHAWEHNGLPADDEDALSTIFHVRSLAVTRRLWSEIAPKFFRHSDGLWRNWRQEAVRVEATKRHQAESARGKAGAAARWGKGANRQPKHSVGNAHADAQASPEHSASNSNHNHNQKEPPKPPADAGGSRRRRRPAHGPSDAEIEQHRKNMLVKQYRAEGLSLAEASRKAGFP